MLKWKWVSLALVTITLSANAEESSKEKFLNNYGRMLAVEARCPSWKINQQKVVEILGPLGYSREFLAEKWFRDAKITDIYEGTGQINRLVVARQILGYSGKDLR